jgi:hypothetical protein
MRLYTKKAYGAVPLFVLGALVIAITAAAQTTPDAAAADQEPVPQTQPDAAIAVQEPVPQTQPDAAAADQELVPPPAWALGDLGCAPMLGVDRPPKVPIRVVGSQDTVIKQMMGPGDTLVISGGSAVGLQPGQRYFVRRVIKARDVERDPEHPLSVHTAGWVQILGVDTYVATATIVFACDGILPDDYLEPYEPPLIAARPLAGTAPTFENMGRVIAGREGMRTSGVGQLVTINRGSEIGVLNGQRFLVFRDKRSLKVDTTMRTEIFQYMADRLPLVEVGEIMVVAVRPKDSTAQIVMSRDAIETGDLIAPIR